MACRSDLPVVCEHDGGKCWYPRECGANGCIHAWAEVNPLGKPDEGKRAPRINDTQWTNNP